MSIRGRAVLLGLAGLPLLFVVAPWKAAALWIAVWVSLVALDVLLAVSPKRLRVDRADIPSVRLGGSVHGSPVRCGTAGRLPPGWTRTGWQSRSPAGNAAGIRCPPARLGVGTAHQVR